MLKHKATALAVMAVGLGLIGIAFIAGIRLIKRAV